MTWLIPITLLVAVCALVGGLIARQVYAVTTSPTVSQTPAASAPASTSDGRPAGDGLVYFTDFAKSDPQFDKVQIAIQNYFNATNKHEYALWRSTMSAAVIAQQTQEDWAKGLRSTKDSDMTVYRIEATDRGADVFGSFTSTQNVEDAPKSLPATCIDWWMVWPLENVNGSLRIDSPSVRFQKCDS